LYRFLFSSWSNKNRNLEEVVFYTGLTRVSELGWV
jgi:hypothetical protein